MSRNEVMPSRTETTELSLAELDHVASGEAAVMANVASTLATGEDSGGISPDFGRIGPSTGGFHSFGHRFTK